MATSTRSKVTRVTEGEYHSAMLGQKSRKIVISILPGDTIMLRQQRCKQQEFISIKEVMEIAKWKRAKTVMMAKRAKRRRVGK